MIIGDGKTNMPAEKRVMSATEYQEYLAESGLSPKIVSNLLSLGWNDELHRRMEKLGINFDPGYQMGQENN